LLLCACICHCDLQTCVYQCVQHCLLYSVCFVCVRRFNSQSLSVVFCICWLCAQIQCAITVCCILYRSVSCVRRFNAQSLSVSVQYCLLYSLYVLHILYVLFVRADSMRNRLSVSTIRFVLFLYLQHIHKISLRASLVSGSDEYPYISSCTELNFVILYDSLSFTNFEERIFNLMHLLPILWVKSS